MSAISDHGSPSTADSATPPAQFRILVIEDNADMREFLQRILKRRGYGYLGAVDGAEGVALALAERPDLILMDLALPVLDGYEATRLLKANPACAATPIVAVTAHARAVDQERALESGCDAYISKPYSIRQLFELIEQFLPPAT
ncbi:MAG: response regulator [Anaerolineae bacterium]